MVGHMTLLDFLIIESYLLTYERFTLPTRTVFTP